MQPDASRLANGLVVMEVRTTFPARDAAEACGRQLVERRLAACVQIEGPITSIYRWQGVVETAEEYVCRCKTTAAQAEACACAIKAMHPYTTPEVLAAVHQGSEAYAAWVRESVAEHGNGEARHGP